MSEDTEDQLADLPPADYADAREAVRALQPDRPLYLLRPRLIYTRSSVFLNEFPGITAYNVRANATPRLIGEVFAAGVDWYACDSLEEIETVRRTVPDARVMFMHPIKSERDIEQAYRRHRVRVFVIDHPEELSKIVANTQATDSTILIRVQVPAGGMRKEGYRYGCDIERAAWLANEVVQSGFKLGYHFNIGSQVLKPGLFDEAFHVVREVMYRARFMLDMISVGGGFPAIYHGAWPKPMSDYFTVLNRSISRLHLPRTCRVVCTPGRALVADAVSLLVRVERRRGQMLYINDGLMGNLSTINESWCQPPVRLVRPLGPPSRRRDEKFMFAGSGTLLDDLMPGPFYLPADITTGDYIEIGQLGAYAGALQTDMQSRAVPDMVSVSDTPPIPCQASELPEDYHSGEYESDDDEDEDDDESGSDYSRGEIIDDDGLGLDEDDDAGYRR